MSLEGWKCPECSRVYAPWVDQCKWCPTVSVDGTQCLHLNTYEATDGKVCSDCGIKLLTLGGLEYTENFEPMRDGFTITITDQDGISAATTDDPNGTAYTTPSPDDWITPTFNSLVSLN